MANEVDIFDQFFSQIEQSETGKVVRLDDIDPFEEMRDYWIETGCPELDFNLGTLGLPWGLVEIAGKSLSGKTTLGYRALKGFQKKHPNGFAFVLSSERRDNKKYAERMGIDVKRVIVLRFQYVEEMMALVQNNVKRINALWRKNKMPGQPRMFFMWDSVGATLSRSEFETQQKNAQTYDKALEKGGDEAAETMDYASGKPGAFAKEAKAFAKYMLGLCADHKYTFVIINHTMDEIGGFTFVKQRKSTGGEWVEYMPSIRLELSVIQQRKIGEQQKGQISQIKIKKNDFGSRRKTKIEIVLGYGIVLSESDIDYAVSQGILDKKGKTYSYKGKLSWSNVAELYAVYRSNSPFYELLLKAITAARHEDVLRERSGELKIDEDEDEDDDE